ncbi:MAG: ATP-binding protein [Actinomycetota bacterium]
MFTSHETVPELVFAVSHDIGEPIREILGFAQLIAERAPQDVEHRFWEDLGHVEGGALRARSMLAALCDYIRVDELEPQPAEVALPDLIDDVLHQTEASRSTLPSEITSDLHHRVATYPVVLRDVLAELLVNAARFGTADDGRAHVAIRSELSDDDLTIVVEDEGPGMTPDETARAVRLFQRLHRRTDHDTIGAGLAIARRKIERCGGALTIDTNPTGRGLRVSVSLPIPVIDLRATVAAAEIPLAS